MVVSVAKATSAEYYTSGTGVAVGAESYYLDAVVDGEPAGQWHGSGAALLGLEGEVDASDMHTLYGEFINPTTGLPVGSAPKRHRSVEERLAEAVAAEPGALPERVEQLRVAIERTDRQSVIGWDATFSVAKSVTVAHTAAHRAELAAIRSGDLESAERFASIRSGIESAIESANSSMLAYAETIATARAGRHGGHSATARWEAAPGLSVASFVQHTSRNIDPQLHVHNVILNRAFCADGKARALDGADLLAQKHALGAVADRVLEEALTARGFEFALRPDGQARELTIVPTQVADLFSSRSRQIGAKVADLVAAAEERTGRELTDLELHRLKQRATLATRAAKDHSNLTREELLGQWWAEAVSVGYDLDHVATLIDAHLTHTLTTGAGGGVGEWSPAAVLSEAVAAVGEKRSTWRPADLMLEISCRLPSLGGLDPKQTVDLLEHLTDTALTGPLVRQVSGTTTSSDLDDDALEAEDRAALEAAEPAGVSAGGVAATLAADPFTRPSSRLYASVHTLAGEEALRRAAIERGGHALAADAVESWLAEKCPSIGADQRAAVIGLATTDARLAVLVGPAGTGKSYTAGAFAGAWADLTDGHGRVIGLAVSQIATQVLADDGLKDAANITRWLGTQDRLADGSTHTSDTAWRLGAQDVVMVDEASMVATADLRKIQAIVEAAGARMVLTGDPRQLGAVEAGGVMGLLDGHAETYTLAEVRRFATDWEPAASLALRDGNPDALAVYDRHGRLNAHETLTAAQEASARAAVADRLDGRTVVVITGSNTDAAAIATKVRDQLAALGLVDTTGGSVLLGRDGCTASAGDLIAARRNDHTVGVTNRAQYRVTEVGADGSLTVTPADAPESGARASITLPAEYVAADVQLGYASTAHGAQGVTVDAAHLVTDGTLDAAGLYVGMTRGRLRNTAHVATTPTTPELPGTFADTTSRPSARSVLEGAMERESTNRAATVEAELDAERLASASILAGRLEAVTRAACRERLDRHLDHLTASGVLDPAARARLGADQGTEHLSRLLRAVEQSGRDPRQVLTDAVSTGRGLGDAESVAQVLSHRITGNQPLPPPHLEHLEAGAAGLPADIAPQAAEHLTHLTGRLEQRRHLLGERLAADPPKWALQGLGPVPTEEVERGRWAHRAGTVAAHREATGWDHPERAIGTMPGLAATERRASHTAAWHALGRPEAALEASGMSDGQLRIRIRAAEDARRWAPPHADASLRRAEIERENARHAAALARAEADRAAAIGDHQGAAAHLQASRDHEVIVTAKTAAVSALTETARARAAWAASSAVTFDESDRAEAEAQRRGLTLHADTAADDDHDQAHAADEHQDDARFVDERDIHEPERAAVHVDVDLDDATVPFVALEAPPPPDTAAAKELTGAHAVVPVDLRPEHLEVLTAATAAAMARVADRVSQEQAHTSAADRDDSTHGVDAYTEGRRRREAADEHDLSRSARALGADDGSGLDV